MSNKSKQKNVKIYDGDFTLDKAEIGKRYIIKDNRAPADIRTRLAEMGLTPDTEVVALKKAPLGDPLEISVRGYSLCIRATEAERFVIKETCDE